MLNFGNKEFRNLQEQVLKNMKDIQSIEEGVTVLADFGIKVVGRAITADDLPEASTYDGEYGDAYIVGEEGDGPFEYYIFTRAFEGEDEPQWFNLGVFPQPGPQGPKGDKGDLGPIPSLMCLATSEKFEADQEPEVHVSRSGSDAAPVFSFYFGIPQGIQGIQGIQGPQGEQGIQGIQGIQGVKGDPGFLYTIYGQYASSSSLPDPTEVARNAAYLVGASAPYDVYVIIGDDTLSWINLGPVATIDMPVKVLSDTTGTTSGTVEAETLVEINQETSIQSFSIGSKYFIQTSRDSSNIAACCWDIQAGTCDRVTISLSTGAWSVTSRPFGNVNSVNSTSPDENGNITIAIPTNNNQLTNGAGYITGITGTMVTSALGFTPYSASNPNGYTSNVGTVTSVNSTSPDSSGNVAISIPSKVSDLSNDSGFISGINSTMVVNALGYTPYSASNPNGYTSNTGTVTSVNGVSPVSGAVTIPLKTINSTAIQGTGDISVQETLVSGTNIRTVNGSSLLGSGDITVSGGGGTQLYQHVLTGIQYGSFPAISYLRIINESSTAISASDRVAKLQNALRGSFGGTGAGNYGGFYMCESSAEKVIGLVITSSSNLPPRVTISGASIDFTVINNAGVISTRSITCSSTITDTIYEI